MILGFKDRFIPYVLDGSKRHTIRAGDRWKPGMRADLFANVRQKGMRLLFRAHVVRVEPIRIWELPILDIQHIDDDWGVQVEISGARLSPKEAESFFWRDGFRGEDFPSVDQALCFWSKQLRAGVFTGQLIHWDYAARFNDVRKIKLNRKEKASVMI